MREVFSRGFDPAEREREREKKKNKDKGWKSFKSERKGEKIEFPPRRRRKILLRLNRISFREGGKMENS